jgi:hypothetical protein
MMGNDLLGQTDLLGGSQQQSNAQSLDSILGGFGSGQSN